MNTTDIIKEHDKLSERISLIAFDADDTLWDCQGHFDDVEADYCRLLAPYGSQDEIAAKLFQTENSNMPLLGYGSKAFTISLVENAIKLTKGNISGDELLKIIDLGKTLLNMPGTPLEGVEETLKELHKKGTYKMVVFTKGDNLDQENKFKRSGLAKYFDDCIVVADKTPHEYMHLCRLFDTNIGRLCMVGNSFKSDILPVLKLGGYAIHIPYELEWQMEQTEEKTEHPKYRRIDAFKQLLTLL
jgi:putative hydrolase of the HAD superfamily